MQERHPEVGGFSPWWSLLTEACTCLRATYEARDYVLIEGVHDDRDETATALIRELLSKESE